MSRFDANDAVKRLIKHYRKGDRRKFIAALAETTLADLIEFQAFTPERLHFRKALEAELSKRNGTNPSFIIIDEMIGTSVVEDMAALKKKIDAVFASEVVQAPIESDNPVKFVKERATKKQATKKKARRSDKK